MGHDRSSFGGSLWRITGKSPRAGPGEGSGYVSALRGRGGDLRERLLVAGERHRHPGPRWELCDPKLSFIPCTSSGSVSPIGCRASYACPSHHPDVVSNIGLRAQRSSGAARSPARREVVVHDVVPVRGRRGNRAVPPVRRPPAPLPAFPARCSPEALAATSSQPAGRALGECDGLLPADVAG